MNDAISILHRRGIRPSYQRVAVLDYLLRSGAHLTADEIFLALRDKEDLPGLSRATVFNSLRTFREHGVVRALSPEGESLRYDAVTKAHGHARCPECGKITDFPLSPSTVSQIRSNLPDHTAEFQLVANVICKDCSLHRT